ncbi:IS1595 family transposase [Asticcacaulis excentricus]|nr:IS1595 family transposase [Asticcacaulis excentricus]
MQTLTDPIFHDEEAARVHFEALRWPDGRVCPHCGVVGNSTLMQGKTTRAGLYKCKEPECRKPFTATMGTIYERSHIPLHKWLLATQIMCSSKKGVSANQLYRMLGFGSYRTAWFMAHRIREAMLANDETPMGGDGGVVEADETFFGRDPEAKESRMAIRSMNKIVTLLDRNSGKTRSVVVKEITVKSVTEILNANVSEKANLVTDEAHHYKAPGKTFSSHKSVNHAQKEYVNKEDKTITTNQIEGFFGIFKRGMRGIYQHCKSHHLRRYLAEFDFRYSNREALGCDDTERTNRAVMGVVGRRLMYQRPERQQAINALV